MRRSPNGGRICRQRRRVAPLSPSQAAGTLWLFAGSGPRPGDGFEPADEAEEPFGHRGLGVPGSRPPPPGPRALPKKASSVRKAAPQSRFSCATTFNRDSRAASLRGYRAFPEESIRGTGDGASSTLLVSDDLQARLRSPRPQGPASPALARPGSEGVPRRPGRLAGLLSFSTRETP